MRETFRDAASCRYLRLLIVGNSVIPPRVAIVAASAVGAYLEMLFTTDAFPTHKRWRLFPLQDPAPTLMRRKSPNQAMERTPKAFASRLTDCWAFQL